MNPYESPRPIPANPPKTISLGRVALAIVLALFTLPAAAFVGLITLEVGDAMNGGTHSETPGIAGVIACLAAGIVMIHLTIRAALP